MKEFATTMNANIENTIDSNLTITVRIEIAIENIVKQVNWRRHHHRNEVGPAKIMKAKLDGKRKQTLKQTLKQKRNQNQKESEWH